MAVPQIACTCTNTAVRCLLQLASLIAGVTLIHPEDLDLPSTMTDIDYNTWMLSGSAVMQDGSTVRNNYKIDLDTLPLGSRVGMMRASDATLHFYLDGEDMGVACSGVPSNVYAVIDLYGQCAQVSITEYSRVIVPENNEVVCEIDASLTSPISSAGESYRVCVRNHAANLVKALPL